MADDIQYEQKLGKHILRFSFEEDYLLQEVDEPDFSRESQIFYAKLYAKVGRYTERDGGFQRTATLTGVLGFLYLVGSVLFQLNPVLMIGSFLMVLCSCFYLYRYKKNTRNYTIIEGNGDTLLVLQDSQHEIILNEVKKRRTAQLKSWYWRVEEGATLDSELQLTKRLYDDRILSKEEAVDRNQYIRSYFESSEIH